MEVLIAVLGALALGVVLWRTIYRPVIERRRLLRRMQRLAGEITATQERLADLLEMTAIRVREFGVRFNDEEPEYDELFIGPLDFPRDAPPVMVSAAEAERNGDGGT